jgi:ADP-ribosylation factor 1/2
MWDVGGQQKLRPLWRHYFQGSNALIWVIDSADRERIAEAAEELQALSREELLSDAVFLVLANKQDLPNAMPTAELARALGLTDMANRNWYIQSTVAATGAGLEEGMAWLAKTVKTSGRR